MSSKKQRLKNSRLYLILDKDVCGEAGLERLMKAALSGGVDIVQLRDKTSSARAMISTARRLGEIVKKFNKIFIVNDRVDVALAAGADGVHIGQDDAPACLVRQIAGRNMLLGISCHSANEVRRANALPVDYLGFGPVFATQTKPGTPPRGTAALKKALTLSRKPIFAIGGITLDNLDKIWTAGARRIAVCRQICETKNPGGAAAQLQKTLASSHV